jgi:hypothetical protein
MFRTRTVVLAAALAGLALMLAPAAGLAKAPVRFGARLDPTVQPSNSLPGLPCSTERVMPCTMVQNEAYGRPGGGEVAPRSGTIKRIRLIAGGPGVFRLQVARVKRSRLYGSSQVKVLADGPKIQYEGQTEANWESDSYRIETFDVDVPIEKGEQLAMHIGGSTSAIRCSSGGDNTLIHLGGKYPRQPFSPVTGDDGCWILMEAVIR